MRQITVQQFTEEFQAIRSRYFSRMCDDSESFEQIKNDTIDELKKLYAAAGRE
jgi:hypothetical protein